MNFVALLGARALAVLRSFGHAAFFFLDLLRAIPPAMRRFGLVVVQIHGGFDLQAAPSAFVRAAARAAVDAGACPGGYVLVRGACVLAARPLAPRAVAGMPAASLQANFPARTRARPRWRSASPRAASR